MISNFSDLKIYKYKEEIEQALLQHSSLLIKSSPGSGKTSFIPYLTQSLIKNKIYVLEPRKIAAKMASHFIDSKMSEIHKIHKFVGYQFRDENTTLPGTQIHFLTEGTFLKILLNNPDLLGIGAVILDEFHERNWQTDLSLGVLKTIKNKRKDLKIIIMSATLNEDKIKSFIGDELKTLEFNDSPFPLEIKYLTPPEIKIPTINLIINKINDTQGDTIVFLPGMKEIKELQEKIISNSITVHILHSSISRQEQESIFKSSTKRKIILSTNIAESSITIDGVETVIDTCLVKENIFEPWNGIYRLENKKTSQFSMIQRAGRANRTNPGECHRLITLEEFKLRPKEVIPDIKKMDLCEIILFTLRYPYPIEFFDHPSKDHYDYALSLLKNLGAIDSNQKLTTIGEFISEVSIPPRFGRILYEAFHFGSEAILESVLNFILPLFEDQPRIIIQKNKIKTFLKKFKSINPSKRNHLEEILITGLYDHLARYRKDQQDVITSSGLTLKINKNLLNTKLDQIFWLVLEIDSKGHYVNKMIPIEKSYIMDVLSNYLVESSEFIQDKKITKIYLNKLLIDESSKKDESSLKNQRNQLIEDVFAHFKESENFKRINFYAQNILNKSFDDFPYDLLKEEFLLNTIQQITSHFIINELEHEILLHLDPQFKYPIDQYCPSELRLHPKKEVKINYELKSSPWIECFIQDLYGQKSNFLIAGKFPITISLLGPHKRSIQKTNDLNSFFTKTYVDFLKEWRREYPKHYWPDDPFSAAPILFKRQLPN